RHRPPLSPADFSPHRAVVAHSVHHRFQQTQDGLLPPRFIILFEPPSHAPSDLLTGYSYRTPSHLLAQGAPFPAGAPPCRLVFLPGSCPRYIAVLDEDRPRDSSASCRHRSKCRPNPHHGIREPDRVHTHIPPRRFHWHTSD